MKKFTIGINNPGKRRFFPGKQLCKFCHVKAYNFKLKALLHTLVGKRAPYLSPDIGSSFFSLECFEYIENSLFSGQKQLHTPYIPVAYKHGIN